METLEWIKQFFPITTPLPIKELGWMIVPSPIIALGEIETDENWKGLK